MRVATLVAVSGPQIMEADFGGLAGFGAEAAVAGLGPVLGMDWPGAMVMPGAMDWPGAMVMSDDEDELPAIDVVAVEWLALE